MGIEVAIMVAAAAEVGKAGMEYSAEKNKVKALNLEAKESQIQYQQKSLSNLDTMQKVLDAQSAAMTTRGVAFSSPSFNAIQRNTLNIGAKNERNNLLEEDITQANIRTEKQDAKLSLFASIFGDVASTALSAIGLSGKGATAASGAFSGSTAGASSSISKLPQMES